MAGPNQSFRSPNYYPREVDASAPSPQNPVGTPAGVIGTANRGPAFVPVTVGNMDQFVAYFGNLDPKRFGPYAVNEFLKNRGSLTYLRVLGAGANSTSADVSTTMLTGRVKNAGVHFDGSAATDDSRGRHVGSVQFITAQHALAPQEAYGIPMFTDNDSFGGSTANVVRGMVLMASGARMMVQDGNANSVGAFTAAGPTDAAAVVSGTFKLIISSSLGNGYANTDQTPGVMIFSASMDPDSPSYFAKVLNTDPDKFADRQHLLYADFAVDAEVLTASYVGVMSGSTLASSTSGQPALTMRQAFGAFDTRYKAPHTPTFISQPFGPTEYDLFSFEATDDGEYANSLFKVTLTNIRASLDASYQYGSFTVQVRSFYDTDEAPEVLETFNNCTLDPNSDTYIGKVIGDRKVYFNFDTSDPAEKRIVVSGKYQNQSQYIRVRISDQVDRQLVPTTCLPFGFRGMQVLKTNDSLNNTAPASTAARLAGVLGTGAASSMSGSILPPVPFRFKITKGTAAAPATWLGQPGATELTSPALCWGVKFERNDQPLNANVSSTPNNLLASLTKFLGIEKLDVLVTGSGADTLNNNKFSLSKVALSNGAIADLTSSAGNHMREACYVRNGKPDTTRYTINDGVLTNRISLATILSVGGPALFNQFSPYAKFSTFFHGGYDGLNFVDSNNRRMNDKSTSFDLGGGAEQNYAAPGLLINPNGVGQLNSNVASYRTAIDIMTDPMTVNTNILVTPGIRESFVADYASQKVRDYGLAYYVMDIPTYDDSQVRLYDDSLGKPDVNTTAGYLDSRNIDNDYVGTYFPDTFIEDKVNKRRLKVPASVAALGALGFNDRVAYPWFAPAGFNRAALDFVSNVAVRLNVTDRDRLYDSRINPIATFPKLGFVIYGQKTMKVQKSALDRVNVRRLLLEVKRIIIGIAQAMVFEQNTVDVRNKFTADCIQQLGLIQAQSGVESFRVVCNESNNTKTDIENNKMNGRIIVVPTRVVEFVSIDFVISQTGVTFT